jgi:inhibitor of cysteine peptidase
MRKRSYWLIAAVFLAAAGVAFAFMMERVSISASPVTLTEQGWKANFSSALHPDAIENGDVFLTDADGEPVTADLLLHENRRTVEVPNLGVGEYKLHVKEAALSGRLFKSLATNEVSFMVQSEISSLSNEEELRAYFTQLLELQRSDERYGLFGAEGESSSDESADSSASGGADGDYSSTNNQVEGVDEADLVKTDGSFIYSISDTRVLITDIRNDEMEIAEEISFGRENYPQQLFLSGDTLVVLGSRYSVSPKMGSIESYQPTMTMTTVQLYDIQDPTSPALLREFGTQGHLNGARLANNILYYVTNVYPDLWSFEEDGEGEIRPHVFDSLQSLDIMPLEYNRISILPGTMEGSYSVISAFDLNGPGENEVSTEAYLGGSEQLYMTEENLYLTASAYRPMDQEQDEESSNLDIAIWIPQLADTEIFKFALNGTSIQFAASAEVTGSLLNQFSMDEHNGYFRVVTTEGLVWDEAAPSKNHLFVLDGGMNQVGSVEDLARGERIYSARFMQNKAYMVTFKETDPLFVIDLAVPSSPEVLGELKIPGFSNYLHPLGENHLIGFGYDTKLEPVKGGEPRVVTGGMKISLFDITDFSNPLEQDTEIIGGPGTHSPLQYDHKALFVHNGRNLYGFPVSIYKETGGHYVEFEAAGAMIYTINEEGIFEAAELLEEAVMQYEDWNQTIQRIIYVGETLYTIANTEVKSYNLDGFEPINELEF